MDGVQHDPHTRSPERWALMPRPQAEGQPDRHDRQRRIPGWNQERLRQAHVLVAGAGAIGNEATLKLALLGFGRITVCDMDRIEPSNLSRTPLFRPGDEGRLKAQVVAERLAALAPQVRVDPIVGPLETSVGTGLIASCDLVLGCLDNVAARVALNRRCLQAGRPYLDAGIDDRSASILVVRPEEGACYECRLGPQAREEMARRYSCAEKLLVAQKQGVVPTVATLAGLAANIQVQIALALLHGAEVAARDDTPFAHLRGGTRVVMTTRSWRIATLRAPRSNRCTAHLPAPETRLRLPLTCAATACAVAGEIERRAGWFPDTLVLDEPVVESLHCTACDETEQVGLYRDAVRAVHVPCPRCGERRTPLQTLHVDPASELGSLPLARLGVPPRAWLIATGPESSVCVELDV